MHGLTDGPGALQKARLCGTTVLHHSRWQSGSSLKTAIAKVLHASWQRCRVHFMRNALAHAGKTGRRVVSAFIATAFAQDDAEAARTQWRRVADYLRPKVLARADVCWY